MEEVIVSAPGKVILAGEHAVVYGEPALVATVGLRCRVKTRWIEKKQILIKDEYEDVSLARLAIEASLKKRNQLSEGVKVEISSELPIGGGLGSSAAMGTAIVWSLLKGYPEVLKDRVVKLVEDKQHKNSSGLDQAIVKEGGVMRYQRGAGFKKLKKKNWPEFLLIDSGKPVEGTGEMVAMVREKKRKYGEVFKRIGEISEQWQEKKIKENQRLLEEIGVVGGEAKKMIREIERIGGMAKISGAGGVKEGSGILLGFHEEIERLKRLVERKKWKYYQVKLGVEGVRYEKN